MRKKFFASIYSIVGWAKARFRAVPTIIKRSDVGGKMVGTAQARLCPPYGLVIPGRALRASPESITPVDGAAP
jgi:hypothetical protein